MRSLSKFQKYLDHWSIPISNPIPYSGMSEGGRQGGQLPPPPDFGPAFTACPLRFLAPRITCPSRFSDLATCLLLFYGREAKVQLMDYTSSRTVQSKKKPKNPTYCLIFNWCIVWFFRAKIQTKTPWMKKQKSPPIWKVSTTSCEKTMKIVPMLWKRLRPDSRLFPLENSRQMKASVTSVVEFERAQFFANDFL